MHNLADNSNIQVLSFATRGELNPAEQAGIDKFEADNPKFRVHADPVPWATRQNNALSQATNGSPPAVAYISWRTMKKFVDSSLIVPAEISDAQAALYQPGVLRTVSSGGKYWGYPHAFSTKGLYINCDLVKAAGLECKAPETWADMIAMAKAIKEKDGVAGIGIAGKDFDNTMHMFLDFLYSNGGTVLDPATGAVTLDSKQTRETLQMYKDILPYAEEGPTAWERDQMKDLFNDGKLGMYVNGPWGYGQHKDKVPNQIVVPVPHGPSGPSGTILITDSIAVFKQKDPAVQAAAQKLAQALTSGDAQYDLDKTWGLTPILQYDKIIKDKPFYVDNAMWKVYVDGISTGGPEPMVTDFKSLQGAFTTMIQGVMLGEGGSIDDLVKQAAADVAAVK